MRISKRKRRAPLYVQILESRLKNKTDELLVRAQGTVVQVTGLDRKLVLRAFNGEPVTSEAARKINWALGIEELQLGQPIKSAGQMTVLYYRSHPDRFVETQNKLYMDNVRQTTVVKTAETRAKIRYLIPNGRPNPGPKPGS